MSSVNSSDNQRNVHDRASIFPPNKPMPGTITRCLAGPVLVGLVLRIIVLVALVSMPLESDALDYWNAGMEILRSFPGSEAYRWPPGTPYTLALFGWIFEDANWSAWMYGLSLGVLNVYLAGLWTFSCTRSRTLAQVGAWIACVYPPSLLITPTSFSQQLTMACLLGFSVLLVRALRTGSASSWTLTGVVLGLGILSRPSMLAYIGILPLFFAYQIWVKHRRKSPRAPQFQSSTFGPLALILASAIVCVPSILHNANLGAGYNISINNERNVLLGNCPYTPNYKTSHLAQRLAEDLPRDAQIYIKKFTSSQSLEARKNMSAEAVRYVWENPGITAWRTLNRIRSFWGFDYLMSRRIQLAYDLNNIQAIPLLLFEAGGYACVMGLALLGLIRRSQHFLPEIPALLILLILVYQLPFALAFSGGTYHFPAMGLLFPLGAAGLSTLVRRDWQFTRIQWRWLCIAIGIFVFIQLEYAYFAWIWKP